MIPSDQSEGPTFSTGLSTESVIGDFETSLRESRIDAADEQTRLVHTPKEQLIV
jgi:hypothetical protein